MTKKGVLSLSEAEHIFYFTIIILPTLILLFVAAAQISSQIRYAVEGTLPDLESKIMETRLIQSPDCFAAKDDGTQRTFEMIERDKFTQEILDICVPYQPGQRSLQVQLIMEQEVGDETLTLQTQNHELNSGKASVRDVYVQVKDFGLAKLRFTHVY